jgi:hypothetical protein
MCVGMNSDLVAPGERMTAVLPREAVEIHLESAAALNQRLRRKAEAVERSRDWREQASIVHSNR